MEDFEDMAEDTGKAVLAGKVVLAGKAALVGKAVLAGMVEVEGGTQGLAGKKAEVVFARDQQPRHRRPQS